MAPGRFGCPRDPPAARIGSSLRRLRYCVAVSLDGFISGPSGECDWITMDPSLDFESFYSEFDAVLLGRETYLFTQQSGGGGAMPGMETFVCSRTLDQSDHPKVKIAPDGAAAVSEIKSKPGKDIWLFGGANLFRSLLDAGSVDTVEVAVMPIMLSSGVQMLPGGARSPALELEKTESLPSGIVSLTYKVGSVA